MQVSTSVIGAAVRSVVLVVVEPMEVVLQPFTAIGGKLSIFESALNSTTSIVNDLVASSSPPPFFDHHNITYPFNASDRPSSVGVFGHHTLNVEEMAERYHSGVDMFWIVRSFSDMLGILDSVLDLFQPFLPSPSVLAQTGAMNTDVYMAETNRTKWAPSIQCGRGSSLVLQNQTSTAINQGENDECVTWDAPVRRDGSCFVAVVESSIGCYPCEKETFSSFQASYDLPLLHCYACNGAAECGGGGGTLSVYTNMWMNPMFTCGEAIVNNYINKGVFNPTFAVGGRVVESNVTGSSSGSGGGSESGGGGDDGDESIVYSNSSAVIPGAGISCSVANVDVVSLLKLFLAGEWSVDVSGNITAAGSTGSSGGGGGGSTTLDLSSLRGNGIAPFVHICPEGHCCDPLSQSGSGEGGSNGTSPTTSSSTSTSNVCSAYVDGVYREGSVCGRGRTGPLCGSCKVGYAREVFSRACQPADECDMQLTAGLLVMVILVILVLALVLLITTGRGMAAVDIRLLSFFFDAVVVVYLPSQSSGGRGAFESLIHVVTSALSLQFWTAKGSKTSFLSSFCYPTSISHTAILLIDLFHPLLFVGSLCILQCFILFVIEVRRWKRKRERKRRQRRNEEGVEGGMSQHGRGRKTERGQGQERYRLGMNTDRRDTPSQSGVAISMSEFHTEMENTSANENGERSDTRTLLLTGAHHSSHTSLPSPGQSGSASVALTTSALGLHVDGKGQEKGEGEVEKVRNGGKKGEDGRGRGMSEQTSHTEYASRKKQRLRIFLLSLYMSLLLTYSNLLSAALNILRCETIIADDFTLKRVIRSSGTIVCPFSEGSEPWLSAIALTLLIVLAAVPIAVLLSRSYRLKGIAYKVAKRMRVSLYAVRKWGEEREDRRRRTTHDKRTGGRRGDAEAEEHGKRTKSMPNSAQFAAQNKAQFEKEGGKVEADTITKSASHLTPAHSSALSVPTPHAAPPFSTAATNSNAVTDLRRSMLTSTLPHTRDERYSDSNASLPASGGRRSMDVEGDEGGGGSVRTIASIQGQDVTSFNDYVSGPYRKGWWAWEEIALFRRFFLFLPSFFVSNSQLLPAVLNFVIVDVYLIAHLLIQPYRTRASNIADSVLLIALSGVCFCALPIAYSQDSRLLGVGTGSSFDVEDLTSSFGVGELAFAFVGVVYAITVVIVRGRFFVSVLLAFLHKRKQRMGGEGEEEERGVVLERRGSEVSRERAREREEGGGLNGSSSIRDDEWAKQEKLTIFSRWKKKKAKDDSNKGSVLATRGDELELNQV
uniref:Transmembrane protein n=1 Tax=Palpitomonas bilix TaxID=652834 RepID=A0A7S3D2U6_9EUKA